MYMQLRTEELTTAEGAGVTPGAESRAPREKAVVP